MHKLAISLATIISFDRHNKEYIQMISYSLEAILSTLITTLISFLIYIIFNYTYILFIYIISFVTIRVMHKGFHFKSFTNCCLFSNIMIFISCMIIKHFSICTLEIILFYIIIAIHYCISNEKNKLITFIYTLLFTLFLYFNRQVSFSIFIAIIFNTLLIIGRKIQCKT